jgi:hypothetical protein
VQAEIGRLFDEHDAGLKGAVDALLAEPGVDRAEVESIMEEFEAERVNSE